MPRAFPLSRVYTARRITGRYYCLIVVVYSVVALSIYMDRMATPRGRGGGGSRGYVASNRYSVLMSGGQGSGGFDSPGEDRNVRGSGEQVSGRGRGETGEAKLGTKTLIR